MKCNYKKLFRSRPAVKLSKQSFEDLGCTPNGIWFNAMEKCVFISVSVQFSFSHLISDVGRRPSPLSSTGRCFARYGASVLQNYPNRPSISSLVFLGSLCVPGSSRQNVMRLNGYLFFQPHDQPNSIWVCLSFPWYLGSSHDQTTIKSRSLLWFFRGLSAQFWVLRFVVS